MNYSSNYNNVITYLSILNLDLGKVLDLFRRDETFSHSISNELYRKIYEKILREAYYQESKIRHPDKNLNKDPFPFQELNKAYEHCLLRENFLFVISRIKVILKRGNGTDSFHTISHAKKEPSKKSTYHRDANPYRSQRISTYSTPVTTFMGRPQHFHIPCSTPANQFSKSSKKNNSSEGNILSSAEKLKTLVKSSKIDSDLHAPTMSANQFSKSSKKNNSSEENILSSAEKLKTLVKSSKIDSDLHAPTMSANQFSKSSKKNNSSEGNILSSVSKLPTWMTFYIISLVVVAPIIIFCILETSKINKSQSIIICSIVFFCFSMLLTFMNKFKNIFEPVMCESIINDNTLFRYH